MTSTEQGPETRISARAVVAAGRHPVNVGHLVMSLVFLGMVGVWALVTTDVVADDDIRWLLPVPWVAAGLGGLIALATRGARRQIEVEPAGRSASSD
jgi:hypothetical protein